MSELMNQTKYEFPYTPWNHIETLSTPSLKLVLQGDAVAGKYSGFYLPEWRVMLDAGLQSPFHPEYIFITHAHTDHLEKLFSILTGINSKPLILVPPGTKTLIETWLTSLTEVSQVGSVGYFRNAVAAYTIEEISPEEERTLLIRKNKFVVKAFQTDHTVTSIGFAFYAIREKLKEEYTSLAPSVLKELRKDESVWTKCLESIKVPQLIYTGDTRIAIFKTEDSIQWNSFPIIITECTYVRELLPSSMNAKEEASKRGHIELASLKEVARIYPNPLFVLVHFSDRHSKNDLKKFFEELTVKEPNLKIKGWI
jgi:ribonuclease Z